MRKKIVLLIIAVVLAAGVYFVFFKNDDAQPVENTQSSNGQSAPANLSNEEASRYTIDNQSSIYFIVNKKRALPSSFVPENLVTVGKEQLRSDTSTAVNGLLSSAKKSGINLYVISGYRSFAEQTKTYNGYVKADGRAKADTYSARPGHSEHQTGLAVDVGTGSCDLQKCFGETKGGKWLAEHAAEFGFIIRYQDGKDNLTGYQYEPWHIRYVGTELADKLSKSGQTMEQFFGLPAATSY